MVGSPKSFSVMVLFRFKKGRGLFIGAPTRGKRVFRWAKNRLGGANARARRGASANVWSYRDRIKNWLCYRLKTGWKKVVFCIVWLCTSTSRSMANTKIRPRGANARARRGLSDNDGWIGVEKIINSRHRFSQRLFFGEATKHNCCKREASFNARLDRCHDVLLSSRVTTSIV